MLWTVYVQKCAPSGLKNHTFTNGKYYEQCNAKVDVGEDIGITRKHFVIMEETAQEKIKKILMDLVNMINWK